jgi:hypothetical protein
MREVDRATVKALKLRAPQASTLDLNAARSLIQAGVAFGTAI